MNKCPMHEKLQKVQNESQLCGEFLEWLQTKFFMIEKHEEFKNDYIPVGYSSYINIQEVLAEYFNIDLNEIEKEKQLMIEEMRAN